MHMREMSFLFVFVLIGFPLILLGLLVAFAAHAVGRGWELYGDIWDWGAQ